MGEAAGAPPRLDGVGEASAGPLEASVRGLLRDALVLGLGEAAFGLAWRYGGAEEPRVTTGGWLYAATAGEVAEGAPSAKSRPFFFVLDAKAGALRQCKDETGTYCYRQLDLAAVRSARALQHPASGAVYAELRTSDKVQRLNVGARSEEWLLWPVSTSAERNVARDREVVTRWVAALRQRCRLVPEEILSEQRAAERVALFCQSSLRRHKAQAKALRMRKRREGIFNKVGGLVYGYEDSDSESDSGAAAAQDGSSSLVTSFISAIAYDLYDNALGARDAKRPMAREPGKPITRQLMKRVSYFRPRRFFLAETQQAKAEQQEVAQQDLHQHQQQHQQQQRQQQQVQEQQHEQQLKQQQLARIGSRVQDMLSVEPLDVFEVEDELWENERWNLNGGWSPRGLLATDRAPFSDRIGRGKYASLVEYGTPEGWRVTREWDLDTSVHVDGRCDASGWSYAINFPPLDSALASGSRQAGKTLRSAVRHRRWYRRRVPDKAPRTRSCLLWHGWLGHQSGKSGRWVSRYFCLSHGLQLHGRATGVCLSFFRSAFAGHLDTVGANSAELWAGLTEKQLSTSNFDGAEIVDRTGSRDEGKYGIEVRVAHELVRLRFDSLEQRDYWCQCIEHAVTDQFRHVTLTRSLSLGQLLPLQDVPAYANPVIDRLVMCQVDICAALVLFEGEFEADVARALGMRSNDAAPWPRVRDAGARRQVQYAKGEGKRKEVLNIKQKLVRASPGEGYQVDCVVQVPTSPYGNIYDNELRIVLCDWKGKNTRLLVSHGVKLNSDDAQVRAYVESAAKECVVGAFADHFVPLLQRAVQRLKQDQRLLQRSKTKLASPTGIRYKLGSVDLQEEHD